MRGNKGFTLIELLVVIAVIGVLAAVIISSLNSTRAKARNARRTADIEQLINAFNIALSSNPNLPDPGNNNWNCVSYTCYQGWAVYSANATIDAFFTPYMSRKPEAPAGPSPWYGGYIYYYNWPGGSTGYAPMLPAGTVLHWHAELPVSQNVCAPGTIYGVDSSYIQCIAYISQ